MNTKSLQYSGIIFLVISLFIISYAAFKMNVALLIMGIILLLVSIFFIFFIQTIDLYKKDKILDIESLKAQGLTIVECQNCHKKNVYEDQYCIFCGEKLEKNDEPL